MPVHAGPRGQCGCILLIPFPRQTPHLETLQAPGQGHQRCLQRATVSQGWGWTSSSQGWSSEGLVLSKTGLSFIK